MNGSTFLERLVLALEGAADGVLRLLPGLLAALLFTVLGLLVAWLARAITRRVLVAARFDAFCDACGVSRVISRADIRQRPSELAGSIMFWGIFVCMAMVGLSALELELTRRLITEFFLYLPRVVAALLIVLAGALLAGFLARATILAAVNAGAPSPRAIALVVKLLVQVLAFAMALEQLQIARSIVLAAFVITFGAVMLALALAFGLGGRDVAARMLDRRFPDRESEPDRDLPHHL